jgi:zinc resistance-associated protein
MKKTIMVLALVMTVAFISTNAMAWGMNGWNGNGHNMHYNNGVNSQVNSQAYQDFLNDTAKLRASIAADQVELSAIMASPSPDAKRARTVTEQMNEKIAKLNEKAAAQNLPQMGNGRYGMMGNGMMGNGMMGNGMMGPGMMNNGYHGCW